MAKIKQLGINDERDDEGDQRDIGWDYIGRSRTQTLDERLEHLEANLAKLRQRFPQMFKREF